MHSNFCEDCGSEIGPGATACPRCGPAAGRTAAIPERPRSVPPRDPFAPPPAAPPPSVAEPAPLAGIRCPRCHSENVRRLTLVRHEGLPPASVVEGGATPGVLPVRMLRTRRSLASIGAAPPKRRSPGAALFLATIAASFFFLAGPAGTGLGVVLLAAAAAWTHRVVSYNRDIHPLLLAEWESSFLCLRCAFVFTPA